MALARKAFEEKVKTKEEEIAEREENIQIKEAGGQELRKKAEKFAEVLIAIKDSFENSFSAIL